MWSSESPKKLLRFWPRLLLLKIGFQELRSIGDEIIHLSPFQNFSFLWGTWIWSFCLIWLSVLNYAIKIFTELEPVLGEGMEKYGELKGCKPFKTCSSVCSWSLICLRVLGERVVVLLAKGQILFQYQKHEVIDI